MSDLVIHEHTKSQLGKLSANPAHAILLTGPVGMGKATLARQLSEELLGLPADSFANYPFGRTIRSTEGKAISIDSIRELEHFLSLKIPGNKQVARIAIVEDSHLLTQEAQNAFLKTLEEPPLDTALILTAIHERALLPTIRSRVCVVPVIKPAEAELAKYFVAAKPEQVKQAIAISGGLPGLTAALLDETSEHPLVEAVRYARELLQKSSFERLLLVDELAKRKELARDTCYVLGHMAQLALAKTGARRWQTIMKAAYEADKALANSAQPKLCLTNLMLQL